MPIPSPRALSRQQRRALERIHAKQQAALRQSVTRIELHRYLQHQRLHRRALRGLGRLVRGAVAFLRAPVASETGA